MTLADILRDRIATQIKRQPTIGAATEPDYFGSVDPLTEYGGAVEESYNPLEDLAPVGGVRRLLGLSGAALGFGTIPAWKLTKNAPSWLRRAFVGGEREVPLQTAIPKRVTVESPVLVKNPVTYELPESVDELAPLLEQLGGSYGKPFNKLQKIQKTQRIEELGAPRSTAGKPHGLYTSPAEVVSPHADLGGVRSEYLFQPQRPLDVTPEFWASHARFRGAGGRGPVSSGIRALKALSGEEEFAALMEMPKKTLIRKAQAEFPNIDWNKYYDSYEILEGLAGERARKAGFDAFVAHSPQAREWAEYVALKPEVVQQKLPSVSGGADILKRKKGKIAKKQTEEGFDVTELQEIPEEVMKKVKKGRKKKAVPGEFDVTEIPEVSGGADVPISPGFAPYLKKYPSAPDLTRLKQQVDPQDILSDEELITSIQKKLGRKLTTSEYDELIGGLEDSLSDYDDLVRGSEY